MDTVPPSKPDLDEIYRRVADRAIDFSEPISPQIYTLLRKAFHSRLAEMAGVPEAWRLVVLSKTHVDRARLHLQSAIPGRAAMAYSEHLSIIDAIRNGDADRAASLMDSHVGSVMDILGDGRTGKGSIPAPGG